jgi:hypothetical protein
MSVPICFDSVVGFTRNPDACLTAGYLPEYSNSDSGLYISELQGMSLRILNSTGGNFSLWEKMEFATENAIAAFKIDVMKAILENMEPARKNFIGDIGGKSFSSVLNAGATDLNGLRMYSDIIGGSYTLRGVTTILNVAEPITLGIYDEYNLLHSIILADSKAGQPSYTAIIPIQFTLIGNLYFLYSTTGLPYNNKLTCNCGGHKWCFNIDHPCYKYSRDRWTEWSMVAGIHGAAADIANREDWPTSREARGMILHGDYGCDTLGILCSDHSDWANNQVDSAIAWAILFKAGSFLSGYIMDSEEVSRYTLLGVDGLMANMAYYEDRYKVMIEFIAANIEEDRNECLRCKNPHGYKRQSQML